MKHGELDDRRERFTAELHACQRQLYGYLFALLRDVEDTQEVFQQTCLTMWQKFDEFEGRAAFGTWACSIGRNKVRDFVKGKSRYRARFSQTFEEHLAAISASIPTSEIEHRRDALEACLEKLDHSEQQLIEQVYGVGAKIADIAAQLRCSSSALYGTLRKLREALFRCIDRSLEERSS